MAEHYLSLEPNESRLQFSEPLKIELLPTPRRKQLHDALREYGGAEYGRTAEQYGLDILAEPLEAAYEYRDAQYVFATRKQEVWAHEDRSLPSALYNRTRDYLWRRGYEPLDANMAPEMGDIVAYIYQDDGNSNHDLATSRFGVYEGGGYVTSKWGAWGEGPIIGHRLGDIPLRLGQRLANKAILYRKMAERYDVLPQRTAYGYYIPENEERQRIDDGESLACLPGVQILVDKYDPHTRCNHYVFGLEYHEAWSQPGTIFYTNHPLWQEPFVFLRTKGFVQVREPQKGDVVMYLERVETASSNQRLIAQHFGVYEGERVRSKLGGGETLEHELGMISNMMGTYVCFLRKGSDRDKA